MGEQTLRPSLGKSLSLVEEESGHRWESLTPVALIRRGGGDYREGSPVEARIDIQEGDLDGRILYSHGRKRVSIPFSIEVQRMGMEVLVGPVEGPLPTDRLEVEFPRGLGWARAGSEGYLIVPIGLGAICDFSSDRKTRTVEKHIYSGGQTGITMPLIGTVQGKFALGCIVDTPFDCKVRMDINRGRNHAYSQTLTWAFDDRTNYRRRAHFFAQPGGDYVSIAKRYRSELIESGRFVSLREKARGNPEVDLTIGSVLGHRGLSFTEPEDADPYSTGNAYGFFRNALRAGFDRVIAHDTKRGDPGDMKRAAGFARSLCPGFRLCVYENYLDIFRPGEQKLKPDSKVFPDWDESLIARELDGSQRPNWRVKRKGQPDLWTYTVCPARRLEVAKPQMNQLFQSFGRGSIYIDVEGAVPLFDCHDERHPATKEQDARFRIDLLKEVKRRFGVVTTEALPQDFLAPVSEVGSYFSVFPYSGYGNSEFRIMPPMIPIPLHTLVWHGSILNQTGTGTNYYQSDPPHAALFGWLADTIDDNGRRIAYKLRGTAHAEMISHEFVTGPRVIVGPDDAFHCDDVQVSMFSDGTVVVANFASLPYRWRGRKIDSMDFLVINERASIQIDHPSRARSGSSIEVEVTVKNKWDRAISGSNLLLLGRGAIYSKSPLMEEDLPEIKPGRQTVRKVHVDLPEQRGESWFVASVQVPGDQPWEAAEISDFLLT